LVTTDNFSFDISTLTLSSRLSFPLKNTHEVCIRRLLLFFERNKKVKKQNSKKWDIFFLLQDMYFQSPASSRYSFNSTVRDSIQVYSIIHIFYLLLYLKLVIVIYSNFNIQKWANVFWILGIERWSQQEEFLKMFLFHNAKSSKMS